MKEFHSEAEIFFKRCRMLPASRFPDGLVPIAIGTARPPGLRLITGRYPTPPGPS